MKLLLPITEYRVHTLELFVLCSTSSLSLSLFLFLFLSFRLSLSLSLAGFTAFESDALAPRPGEEAAFFKAPVGFTSSLSLWLLFRLLFADSRGRSEKRRPQPLHSNIYLSLFPLLQQRWLAKGAIYWSAAPFRAARWKIKRERIQLVWLTHTYTVAHIHARTLKQTCGTVWNGHKSVSLKLCRGSICCILLFLNKVSFFSLSIIDTSVSLQWGGSVRSLRLDRWALPCLLSAAMTPGTYKHLSDWLSIAPIDHVS